VTTAAEFVAEFEGYAGVAYWDVNAYRLGYGSDTEGPEEIPVTKGMETTKERAIQNLALRVKEFAHEAIYGKNGMGADTWLRLTENQRSAILSIVYNYGRLPSRVVIDLAAPEKTAATIRALQSDNGGVNHRRRLAEAQLYLTGATTAPQPAPPVPVPQAPVPQLPGPPSPLPAPSPRAGEPGPQIPASWAARLAVERDQLIALQAEYRKEIPTPFDEAIASLEKFGTAPIHAALPKPAAEPAVVTQPLTQRMKMNPQVSATLRSILLALGGAAVSKGIIDQSTLAGIVGVAISAISYGWSLWGHTNTQIIAAAASLPEVQKIIAPSAIADSPKFAANPKVVSH
jgi:GH24 family phage-related lysozyme (muramidase)